MQKLHFIKISERIKKGAGLVEIAHRTDFYIINIVNEGASRHMVDFQEVGLKRGDVLIITPGQVHKFINTENYDGFLIAFPKDFLYQSLPDKHFLDRAQIFNSIQNVARLDFPEQELASVMAHVERMRTELAGSYDEFQASVLRNDLFNLLFLLERSFIKMSNQEVHYRGYSQDCLYVMNFKKLISQTFRRETKVQYYAKEMNISERTLQKAVLQVLGKSPKELINEQVVLESKRLLVHGAMSVKEVSYELGFKEPSHFTKFFKTRTGVFPTQFKEDKMH